MTIYKNATCKRKFTFLLNVNKIRMRHVMKGYILFDVNKSKILRMRRYVRSLII